MKKYCEERMKPPRVYCFRKDQMGCCIYTDQIPFKQNPHSQHSAAKVKPLEPDFPVSPERRPSSKKAAQKYDAQKLKGMGDLQKNKRLMDF